MVDLNKVKLSTRQREVLTMLCCGMRQTDIARELRISRSAVNHFARAIYVKLGVSSLPQALIVAILFNLVDTDRLKKSIERMSSNDTR